MEKNVMYFKKPSKIIPFNYMVHRVFLWDITELLQKNTYRLPNCFTLVFLILLITCSPVNVKNDDAKEFDRAFYVYNTEKDYSTAIDLFERIIDKYPWSSKLDNSQYYLGRSHMKLAPTLLPDTLSTLSEFESAIDAFLSINSKSSKYDEGQHQIGVCQEKILQLK